MILTCPNCATRFFAEEEQIGPVGRRVKCDACAETWTAFRAAPSWENAPLAPNPEPPVSEPWTPGAAGEVEEGQFTTVDSAAPLFVQRPAATLPPLAGRRRRWPLALLIALLLALAAALVFQRAVVRATPGTAPIYHSMGMDAGRPRD